MDTFDHLIRSQTTQKVSIENRTTVTEILFFMFLYLKLTNQIHWSWFWIFSPLIFQWLLAVIVNMVRDYKREHRQ